MFEIETSRMQCLMRVLFWIMNDHPLFVFTYQRQREEASYFQCSVRALSQYYGLHSHDCIVKALIS